ncbi:hypothetical protein GCM10027160_38240 [Streptomyces calidiresistens]|uniref:hypothetical protein n=1 Tax=Streptomyces calidiresistens TaxID=1485586 RepID=UPI002B22038E|nr:hypothetical protein [Streptomyces calidiresistens]
MNHPSPHFSSHRNSPPPHDRGADPEERQKVLEFDAAIRKGNARANATGNRLLGQAFLHRSRVPLDRTPIDHVTAERAALRGDAAEAEEMEHGVLDGRSPWACRGEAGTPTRDVFGLAS